MIRKLLLLLILTIGGAAVSSVPVARDMDKKAPFVLSKEAFGLSAEKVEAGSEDRFEARRFPAPGAAPLNAGPVLAGQLLPQGQHYAQPGASCGRPLYLLHHSFLFYDLG